MRIQAMLPGWLRHYQRDWLSGDMIAGLIVTVMLIPQSLAYAMLAGVPPEIGLYASILPLIAYALLGSSMTLAVGPVAVVSLMTASALTPLATQGTPEYLAMAILLALLSGLMLIAAGLLRLGFLAWFLSHPVISGFISGSAVLIAIGQVKYLLGITFSSTGVLSTLEGLIKHLPETNVVTAGIGITALVFLFFARSHLALLLKRIGVPAKVAEMVSKLAPMTAVILSTTVVASLHLDETARVSIVGKVPAGLPSLSLSMPGWDALHALWVPAMLISLVGFVESVSVAQSLAIKRSQRIQPDRELLGIGAANITSALSGGFPVTGGFARSVVNFSAGANTPLSGVISALMMSVVLIGLTSWFHYLPHTVLSATIIVAVLGLIDMQTLKHAWHYDKADATALLLTFFGVIVFGVEEGIVIGVALSLAVQVWRLSLIHI